MVRTEQPRLAAQEPHTDTGVKLEAATTSLTLQLRADSGYYSSEKHRINPSQWARICAVIYGTDPMPDLLEALKGVVAVADRKTVEFDAARAAIAKASAQ